MIVHATYRAHSAKTRDKPRQATTSRAVKLYGHLRSAQRFAAHHTGGPTSHASRAVKLCGHLRSAQRFAAHHIKGGFGGGTWGYWVAP